MSKFTVIWSPMARRTYIEILEYLCNKWTVREMENFISRTENVIQLISEDPLIYPRSKETSIHKCVVAKQVSLFYRQKDSYLEILRFWGNRQNPAKLKF